MKWWDWIPWSNALFLTSPFQQKSFKKLSVLKASSSYTSLLISLWPIFHLQESTKSSPVNIRYDFCVTIWRHFGFHLTLFISFSKDTLFIFETLSSLELWASLLSWVSPFLSQIGYRFHCTYQIPKVGTPEGRVPKPPTFSACTHSMDDFIHSDCSISTGKPVTSKFIPLALTLFLNFRYTWALAYRRFRLRVWQAS